jgi:hypothetical protein
MPEQLKKVEQPLEDAFWSRQLELFQNILANTADERDRISHTIDLWDAIPKYYISRAQQNKLRSSEGTLRTISKEFQYGRKTFKIRIRPARLTDKDGNEKEFYASAREELVEDALRKIAAEQGYGFMESDNKGISRTGVIFSLYMLRQELNRRGHSMSYYDIVESLLILKRTHIEICPEDSGYFECPILLELGTVSRQEWLKNPKARWVAHFNSMVTNSIEAVSFRQYDYHTMMTHKHQLSRWFHKRLAHNYRNAHYTCPYTIQYSTIMRDSCLLENYETRFGVREVDKALKELKEHNVLMDFKKEVIYSARKKIQDIKYTLTPSMKFIAQMKAANERHRRDRQLLEAAAQ